MKFLSYILLSFLYQCGCQFISAETASSPEHRKMEKRILQKLSDELFVVSVPSETVVEISDMVLRQILDVDEKNSLWTVQLEYILIYYLNGVYWNASSYANITTVELNPGTYWKPPIHIKETVKVDQSFTKAGIASGDPTYEIAFVMIAISDVLKLHCNFNIRKFPFDDQRCTICLITIYQFTHWILAESILAGTFQKTPFFENDQWELVNRENLFEFNERNNSESIIENASCPISYEAHLRRRPQFYSLVIVLPIVTTYLVSGLALCLPSDSGEKVSFAVTVFLAQVVAFTALNDILPASSINVPLILYFVSFIMLHMVLLCLHCVIVVTVGQKRPENKISPRIRCFLSSDCMKILFLRPLKAKQLPGQTNTVYNEPEEQKLDSGPGQLKDDFSEYWQLLAHAVDRIGLIFHIILTVVNLAYFGIQIML